MYCDIHLSTKPYVQMTTICQPTDISASNTIVVYHVLKYVRLVIQEEVLNTDDDQ